jgi:hypothetical protein
MRLLSHFSFLFSFFFLKFYYFKLFEYFFNAYDTYQYLRVDTRQYVLVAFLDEKIDRYIIFFLFKIEIPYVIRKLKHEQKIKTSNTTANTLFNKKKKKKIIIKKNYPTLVQTND